MQQLRQSFFVLLILATVLAATAQKNEIIRQYIVTYKDLAIEEMQRTGVPASIKLAQGIHETMAGTSNLVIKSNNHFGIKCKTNWTGESVSHDDDARGECFRKYPSAQDSYRDHSNFLKNSTRYASLFALDPTDYQGWANGLKKAGYATNPKYPLVIIKLIEDYDLQSYTLIAMGKTPLQEESEVNGIASQETKAPPAPIKEENNVEEEHSLTVKSPETYPQGSFMVNETKVVFVRQGTSYLAVARQYSISLGRLFEFNDMKQAEAAEKDQLLYLQRKRKTGKSDFHTVSHGETLHAIAQQEAMRLESLLEYNGLNPNEQPAIGEKLYLRHKASSKPRLMLKENYTIAPAGKTGQINN